MEFATGFITSFRPIDAKLTRLSKVWRCPKPVSERSVPFEYALSNGMCSIRNWFFRLALVFVTLPVVGSACCADEITNRYNVLFIAIDDLRPELGCYGVDHAQSPNLDRFARSALIFDRHYVQVATCGASRYALLTGRSPHRSGVTAKNNAFHSGETKFSTLEQPGAQSMPELFRRSGYKTTLIGKVSHTADGLVYGYDGTGDGRLEMPNAWDDMLTPLGSWGRGWGVFFAYANGKHREDGGGHRDLWQFTVENDEDLPDGLNAKVAIEQLKKHKESGERFFMGVGFYKPHLPFVAPRQDWEAFEDVEIPLPKPGRVKSPYWHASNEFYKYDAEHEKPNPLSASAIRNSKRAYSACVRYVDRQVGKVLTALDELELSKNTIVVVWGDHGWHLGEQEIWAKHAPFERSTRSVLMMYMPGMRTAGKKSRSLAASIDIYPTLVDVCFPRFRQSTHELDGVSLMPILRHERARVRSSVRSYWKDAITVRTDRHRLVAKVKDGEVVHRELYDLTDTEDSIKDLSESEPELVAELEQLLPK